MNDALLPLHLVAPFDESRDAAVLRLTDGKGELGYVIAEALDIVTLPVDLAPELNDGIAGIAKIGGVPVELIDAHALFAAEEALTRGTGPRKRTGRPLCLLHADDEGWMAGFLKPTQEAAGYRCVTRVSAGDEAALVLAMDDAPPPDRPADGAPTIRLRRERSGSDGSIYRYDREALVAAMDERTAAERAMAGGRR